MNRRTLFQRIAATLGFGAVAREIDILPELDSTCEHCDVMDVPPGGYSALFDEMLNNIVWDPPSPGVTDPFSHRLPHEP